MNIEYYNHFFKAGMIKSLNSKSTINIYKSLFRKTKPIEAKYKKEVKITKILLKISHKKAPLREAQPKQNLKIKKKKGNKRNDKKRPGKKKRFFTITT